MRQQRDVDWDELSLLARELGEPGRGPGSIDREQWRGIETALAILRDNQDWEGIVRLRGLFSSLIIGETASGEPLVRELNKAAIQAAKQLGRKQQEAQFRHDRAHNLHRFGYHQEAIEEFERASGLYEEAGQGFKSVESYYMTALCHRALGDRGKARKVLAEVMDNAGDDAWRRNPMIVLAWLAQDDGEFEKAERLLRQAARLTEQEEGELSILLAQTLADLGEVVSLLKRHEEAVSLFERSLKILQKYEGQYDRQEARTKLKLAEALSSDGQAERALELLDEADDKVRQYGHYYDLLWRIEMARAVTHLRQRRLGLAVKKIRAALDLRHELGLPDAALATQVVGRLRSGSYLSWSS